MVRGCSEHRDDANGVVYAVLPPVGTIVVESAAAAAKLGPEQREGEGE